MAASQARLLTDTKGVFFEALRSIIKYLLSTYHLSDRHILIITHLRTRTKVTPYVAQLAPWEVDHNLQVHKIKSAR